MLKRAIAATTLVLLVPFASGASVSAQAPKTAAAHQINQIKKPKPKPKKKPVQVPVTLDGAGASSIEPFFASVFYYYHQTYPKVTINYDPAGSSVGVSDIQQDTVAFGDSEIPMAAKDLAKAKGTVLQVPVDLGGVAISYNVPGVPSGLKLDGPTLASILDGTIQNWDSPVIAAETGNNNLPNLPIVVVHRADSAGPSWDVDEYLIETAPSWVKVIGTKTPSKTWPITGYGLGEQLNSGVATYIAQTKGAIGYVEYGYAAKAGFTNAALLNSAGQYVVPSEPSIGAAGNYAQNLSPSNFNIINEPGAITYPVTNFSWTLLYQKQSNLVVGEALQALFTYVVTTGQALAAGLGYAPLPNNVVALAQSTLKQLETSTGKPLPS
jgi:phosphate transport system substrate-binding protein